MAQKKDFTIQRGDRIERTVVGVDGQKHVMPGHKRGKNGHFTSEGPYRRAIETAVQENRGWPQHPSLRIPRPRPQRVRPINIRN